MDPARSTLPLRICPTLEISARAGVERARHTLQPPRLVLLISVRTVPPTFRGAR